MSNFPRNHNLPPPDVPRGELPPATMTLKRATGEIEIRGRNPDFLAHEQINHPGYIFNAPQHIADSLWSVTGMKVA